MTGLIRTVVQVVIARVLASPIGAFVYEVLDVSGISEERLADVLTIVVLGAGVALARVAKTTRIGAKLVEWANLILSAGRTATGPTYVGRHTVEHVGRHEDGSLSERIRDVSSEADGTG